MDGEWEAAPSSFLRPSVRMRMQDVQDADGGHRPDGQTDRGDIAHQRHHRGYAERLIGVAARHCTVECKKAKRG